jgi:uncharacterized membrane protein (UPF0127 family)
LLHFIPRFFAALFIVAGMAVLSVAAEFKPVSIIGENGTSVFNVEIAVTQAERSKGLMFRRSMDDDAGMIFDFGSEQDVSMWMRNTYIALDMLFIREDGRIGHIAEETTPLSDTIIPSRIDARFVLEIKGGQSRRRGIKAGDLVSGPAIDDLR